MRSADWWVGRLSTHLATIVRMLDTGEQVPEWMLDLTHTALAELADEADDA